MNGKPRVVKFWDDLYREGKTPWDQGCVPERLKEHVSKLKTSKRILVPGCGSAYEAKYLSDAGFEVTAVDISIEAVEKAKETIGNSVAKIELNDFFEMSEKNSFHYIYERAFLCSFNPSLREKYYAKCLELLKADGQIFGFFFIDREKEEGPPFPISMKNLASLMQEDFALIEDEAHEKGLPVFEGCEKWQIWQRKR